MLTRMMIVGGFALFFATGCGSKGPAPEAPPPKRPKLKSGAVTVSKKDCKQIEAHKLPGAMPDKQRRKVASLNLAAEANSLIRGAGGVKSIKQEKMIEQAVEKLNTALAADPYNVEATYMLAGVQAMVGRTQCTVNLLSRLLELYRLDSYKMAVKEKIDQLEGRGKFAGKLDPKFAKVRGKAKYRDLARKFPK